MLQRNQHISTEVMTAIILISGLATIAYFGVSGKVNNIFLVAIFPFAALFFGVSVRYPIVSLLSYGIVASFWGIIYRILIRQSNISILLEISLIYFFACMLFHVFITRDLNWKRAINAMTLGYAVWFLFCFMEILNPRGLTEAWINARGFYPSTLLFAIFCSVLLSRYKLVKILVMTIAIFTIIAFIKMLVQKYIGFDQYERNWLYSTRSYTTHILSSGIRYFSIFSDAGNFGSNMGNVTIVYAIIAFNTLEKKLRLFYFIISALGLIGLFLSGTRGAMIVPLGGLMLFCLIIKNVKLTLMSGILGVCIYVFFAFTYIGEGNQFIRRMRTAFRPTEDASFNVRLDNQRLIAEYLNDKPFGEGIGLAGGEGRKYEERYITQFPVDSYYVKIWVQTGIVGLILHIAILITMLLWGCYLVMFRVKDKQLKITLTAMLCGLFGLMLSAYGNQFFSQPNTQFILITFMACILNGSYMDRQIAQEEEQKKLLNTKKQTI